MIVLTNSDRSFAPEEEQKEETTELYKQNATEHIMSL